MGYVVYVGLNELLMGYVVYLRLNELLMGYVVYLRLNELCDGLCSVFTPERVMWWAM